MEIYKNSYDKNEDMMLWELHEIRHELHKELSQKTVEEINREALRKFQDWQRKYRENQAEQSDPIDDSRLIVFPKQNDIKAAFGLVRANVSVSVEDMEKAIREKS